MSDLKNFLNTLTKAATQPSEALPAPNARKKMKTSEDSLLETSVFGYTDINKFEHCARSLQKNVRIIVEEAPDSSKLEEYAQDNSVDKFARQEIQSNGLLHLVAKLKTLYEDNQMQIAWIGFSRACMPGVFGRESVGESIINSRANGGASKTESSLDKQAKASAVLLKTKTVHLLCNQTIGTGRGQYWLPNVQSLHMNPSLQSRSEVT